MLFSIRKFMNENGFFGIDTPILAKATPEGARDFRCRAELVNGFMPCHNHHKPYLSKYLWCREQINTINWQNVSGTKI